MISTILSQVVQLIPAPCRRTCTFPTRPLGGQRALSLRTTNSNRDWGTTGGPLPCNVRNPTFDSSHPPPFGSIFLNQFLAAQRSGSCARDIRFSFVTCPIRNVPLVFLAEANWRCIIFLPISFYLGFAHIPHHHHHHHHHYALLPLRICFLSVHGHFALIRPCISALGGVRTSSDLCSLFVSFCLMCDTTRTKHQ